MNFSGRDVSSNEEFDRNALFHAPRYLLFAHHSSNSQTGLNRFKPEQEGGWRMWLHSLKVAQLLGSAACLHTNQSRSYLNHLVQESVKIVAVCYIRNLGLKFTCGVFVQ